MTRRRKIITASIASLPFSILGLVSTLQAHTWYIILGSGLLGFIITAPVFWVTLPRE